MREIIDFKIDKINLPKTKLSKLTKKQKEHYRFCVELPNEDLTNYQNDGMGCPTSEIKKPNATKLKRVK